MQPLRIKYSFMLVLIAPVLLFENTDDEKQFDIFIASLVIKSTAMDDINIPGKNISAWKHIPFIPYAEYKYPSHKPMQTPLANGIIGAKIKPHIDKPIKNDISTNINVDEIEAINTSNNGLFNRSLKSLRNSVFTNFIMFSSANFINIAPKNIPNNKNIAKNTSILFFFIKPFMFAFLILHGFLFKLTAFINFAP